MSGQWVEARPHRLHALVCGENAGDVSAFVIPNLRAFNLFNDVIPRYFQLVHTLEHAERLARQAREYSTAMTAWPRSADDLTEEWLAAEVRRRISARDSDVQQQVLQEVIFYARGDANDLINEHLDDLMTALGDQLNELVRTASEAVEQLGPDVHTAAQAIEAGSVDAWSTLQKLVRDYTEIRELQRAFYQSMEWPFDRKACGDFGDVDDPEARTYYHARIAEVAPDWRADRRPDSTGKIRNASNVPWPADAAERLVWCVRNDSGIWCPTPAEVTTVLSGQVPPRNPGPTEQKLPRERNARSEKTMIREAVNRVAALGVKAASNYD